MKRLALLTTGSGSEGHPMLGLGYIASYLRKYMNHDNICIIDKEQDLIKALKREKPDVIGITATTLFFGQAIEFSKTIKENFDIPIIIGGVHISTLPQNLPKNADIGVIGEGEETMLELMQAFESNGKFLISDLKNIKGIEYRSDGELVINPPRPLTDSLDKIPYPARDLFKMKEIYLQPRRSFELNRISRCTNIITSRGCPYKCVFCSSSIFWDRIRFHSPEYVVGEIKSILETYGINEISIFDDLFIANKERLKKIVDLLEKEGIPKKCRFRIYGRANLITEETCQLIKRMNVEVVAIGFESGSQKVLDYLKKRTSTVEMNRNSIQLLKKYDIAVDGLFMINTPGETAEDMMETLKFIQENPIDTLEISITTAFPGTELWEYAKKEGLVSDDMDWNLLNTHIAGEKTEEHKMLLDKDVSTDDFKRIYDLLIKEQEKRNCSLKFKWSDVLSPYLLKMVMRNPAFAVKSLHQLIKRIIK